MGVCRSREVHRALAFGAFQAQLQHIRTMSKDNLSKLSNDLANANLTTAVFDPQHLDTSTCTLQRRLIAALTILFPRTARLVENGVNDAQPKPNSCHETMILWMDNSVERHNQLLRWQLWQERLDNSHLPNDERDVAVLVYQLLRLTETCQSVCR